MPAYWFIEEAITGGIIDRGDYKEVNLQAMSLFPFDQENGKFEDIPEKWRALDGQKVLLKGEMWAPNSSSSDISKFDLVYSISKCCNSGPQQIQQGQTYDFEGMIQIPANANPSFRGSMIKHTWEVQAGLDMTGNDPDSGWQVIEVG